MTRPTTHASRSRSEDIRTPVDSARAWGFALLAAFIWFEVLRLAARSAPAGSPSPPVAATAGLAAQLAFTAVEASLGVAAWGALGRRARWSALAPALLVASVAEAAAVALAAGQPPLAEPWGVLLAGRRAGPGPVPAEALGRAFTCFGALTLLRFSLAAHAHAAAARVRWRHAAVLVLGFYLASRLVVWWSLDLLQGRSHGG
jgi:hypothetical protein